MAIHGTPSIIPGQVQARVDSNYDRACRRTYRCYFDTSDSEFAVMNGLPAGLALYSQDPDYSGFVVTAIEVSLEPLTRVCPSCNATVNEWRADISYGPFTNLLNSATGNPVDQPPRFRFQSNRIEKVADRFSDSDPDNPGALIVNTAGDPFNPRPVKDATAVILIVTRNEANPNFPNILQNWVDHVNQAAWNGFPARTLKVCPINLPERLYSQFSNQLYYPMEYQFEYNPDTWDLNQLSIGFREKDPNSSTGDLRNITINGDPIGEAVALDANGERLKSPIPEGSEQYIKGQIYDPLDFSVFGMNNLFANTNAPPPTGGS